jgi:hypothetical protein
MGHVPYSQVIRRMLYCLSRGAGAPLSIVLSPSLLAFGALELHGSRPLGFSWKRLCLPDRKGDAGPHEVWAWISSLYAVRLRGVARKARGGGY